MSSSQNESPPPKRSASSSPNPPEQQAISASESALSAEAPLEMHPVEPHHPPSPMISPASSTSIEVTPLTAPDSGVSTPPAEDSTDSQAVANRHQPIPPASEPMQYRAIGLVQGRYQASDEQFTRGAILAEDGTLIDAVLLGRVMSLVRKHLDLEQSHLWVVYPRTRDKTNNLHMQIVGVWEPEKLAQGEVIAEVVPEKAAPEKAISSDDTGSSEHKDGYFSIRGEVLFYSPDDQRMIVKIQQLPRPGSEQGKVFKLNLNGALPGQKSVGYFWDLQVQRQDNALVVRDSSLIALVPPKKRKEADSSPDRRRSAGQGNLRKPAQRPTRTGRSDADGRPTAAPAARREPIQKPVKRPKPADG